MEVITTSLYLFLLAKLRVYTVTGYIIPHPVITNFLTAFRAGRHADMISNFGAGLFCFLFVSVGYYLTGACMLGLTYMLCENPSLRKKHKMKGSTTGVLVTKVQPLAAAAQAGIKEDDVVCEIEGCKVIVDRKNRAQRLMQG